jgi:hypothetical protein
MAAHPRPEVQIFPVTSGGTASDGEMFYWSNNTGHSTTITASDPNNWPLTQTSYGPIPAGASQAATVKTNAPGGTYGYNYSDQIADGVGHIIIR